MKISIGKMLIMLFALIAVFLTPIAGNAVVIDYLASSTGQTATADFIFTDSNHLQIILTETTPAATSSLTGAGAILTSIGFILPGSAVIVLPGTATIYSGSSSLGFDINGSTPPQDYGAGTDVSGEWGATLNGEKPIGTTPSTNWDFVSGNEAQVTKFAGLNLDGPDVQNGPQGGLLDDSAARGGLGIIDKSVLILLTLDADPLTIDNQGLSSGQQTAFLNSLSTQSIVEYGSDAAFGTPVPEPGTMLLLGSGLVGLVGWGRKKFPK